MWARSPVPRGLGATGTRRLAIVNVMTVRTCVDLTDLRLHKRDTREGGRSKVELARGPGCLYGRNG